MYILNLYIISVNNSKLDLSAKIKSVTNQISVIREANRELRIENFVRGEANRESRIEILGLILANQIRQDESRDSPISAPRPPRFSKNFQRKLCRKRFRGKSECFDMFFVPVVISIV